ncbi:MAG TPA: POTRA domain-containing protein, partial [Gammaproteobacteria bacterium]
MKSLRAYLIFPLVVLLTLSVQATAQDSFVVEEIRLEGLQRISAGTIFNYLPIKVGDRVDSSRTAEAIRALFRTGFFRDITIEREGNTLVVFVTERPSISSIEFSGNKTIETEDLMKSLRDVGFAEGRVFNRSIFDSVEQELRRSYFSQGRYAVIITSTVTPLERNRVAVNFDISEGKVAKIKQINIVGNESFDDDELVDLFSLTTPNIFSIFTKSDQYSKQKLAADLEALRSFYLDR